MRQIKLSAKLFWSYSLLSTFTLVATVMFVGTVFYANIESQVEGNLDQSSQELIQKHISFQDNNIRFKYGPDGETIASHLREVDTSAIILDQQLNPLGIYGIYKNLNTQNKLSEVISADFFSQIKPGGYIYRDKNLINSTNYDTLSRPIIYNDQVVGYLQIAKEGKYITMLFNTIAIAALFVIPLCILLNWLLAYLLAESSLKQLSELTSYIQTIHIGHLPGKIKNYDSNVLEVALLSKSFNKMIARIKEGVDSQKRFIANISHEINTPLHQTLSTIEIVESFPEIRKNKEIVSYLKQAKSKMLSLSEVVSSILHFSVTKDKSSVEIDQVNVETEVTDILEKYKLPISTANLKVSLVNLKHTVAIPKRYFQILIGNLIQNAVKHNKNGGKIVISADIKNDNSLAISVENNIGKSRKAVTDSHGLGSKLSRGICEMFELKITQAKTDNTMSNRIDGFKLW